MFIKSKQQFKLKEVLPKYNFKLTNFNLMMVLFNYVFQRYEVQLYSVQYNRLLYRPGYCNLGEGELMV